MNIELTEENVEKTIKEVENNPVGLSAEAKEVVLQALKKQKPDIMVESAEPNDEDFDEEFDEDFGEDRNVLLCPKCESETTFDSNFCWNCGQRIITFEAVMEKRAAEWVKASNEATKLREEVRGSEEEYDSDIDLSEYE